MRRHLMGTSRERVRAAAAAGLLALAGFTVPGAAGRGAAPDLSRALAEGKLKADLGDWTAAATSFGRVAEAARGRLRWEALVRLGAARRALGDDAGAVEAFGEVAGANADDPEALAFLVETITGVRPTAAHWDQVWEDVRLAVVEREGGSTLDVRYPGTVAGRPEWSGAPISAAFEDAGLAEVLRVFSAFGGVNFRPGDSAVLHPAQPVDASLVDVPWDEALDRILQSRGLRVERRANTLTLYSDAPGARVYRSVAAPSSDPDVDETTASLRTVGIAMKAHAVDHGAFPVTEGVVDVSTVAASLEPAYVVVLPRWDAWGRPLKCWSDGRNLIVASAGADGVLDFPGEVGLDPSRAASVEGDLAFVASAD